VLIALCLALAAGPSVYGRFKRHSASSELDRLTMPRSWELIADTHRGPTFGFTAYHRIGRQFLAPARAGEVAEDSREIAEAAGWAVNRDYASGPRVPECSEDYRECWSQGGYHLFLETAEPERLGLASCADDPDSACTAVTWTITYD
jgi:hypothetical protein